MSAEDQMVLPRHVLCVLGETLDFAAVEAIARQAGGSGFTLDHEYSEHGHDRRMSLSFQACLANDTFGKADWESVLAHDSVGYVLSPPMTRQTALDVSRRTLAVVAALLRADATAVKNESSGLTHGRERWLSLADQVAAATEPEELAAALFHTWVKRPISRGDLFYSCGMHLLGRPDVELEVGGLAEEDLLDECLSLIDGLAIYLLTDQRAPEIGDGDGFRPAADEPRWVLWSEPGDRYDEDDLFFNPYGYWRLTPDRTS